MRLRALSVRDFGAVVSADVSFEDGLNVLHGPNDLGKSTLAAAIRAALLLQHGSSAARPYIPWGSSRKPSVTLTFEVDGRWWRVHKVFGTTSGGKSVLEWSNDGTSFSVQEEGRGVDGELRTLLNWGLAAPGGRGGSHGFPKSFLATVLLGEQAMPYQLLQQSLEGDAEDTGKTRLIEALQAMATDPLYQQVLLRAQERVDEAFTAKGKRSTRKGSPFERVGAEIKARREASEQLIAQVAESDAVVARLGDLAGARDRALTARTDAAKVVERIEEALASAKEREALQAEVNAAKAALEDIQRNQEEIGRLHAELSAAKASVPVVQGQVEAAAGQAQAARAACDKARATVEALAAGEDPQQRAEAEARAAALREVEAEATRLQALEAKLATWRSAYEAVAEAQATRAKAQADVDAVAAERAQAEADAAAATQRHDALRDATRWSSAESLSRKLEALRQQAAQAETARTDAAAKRAQADALDEQLSGAFPDAEARARIEAAWNQLQVREAALGGGVRVAFDLQPGVSAQAVLDEGAAQDVTGQASVDAEREAVLTVPSVGTITVRPGDPTAHAALSEARASWEQHAATLKAVGVASVAALADAAKARAAVLAQQESLRREAELLEAQAKPPAVEALASTEREVEAAERALEGVDAQACSAMAEQHGEDLGAATREAEAEADRAARALTAIAARASEADTQLRLAEQQLQSSMHHEQAARADGEDPKAAADALAGELAALQTRKAELEAAAVAATEAAGRRQATAAQSLAEAEASLKTATEAELTARAALDDAKATFASTEAALAVRREQAQSHDTFAAAERVARAQDALDAHPAPTEDLSEDAVSQARGALSEADEALEDAERAVRQQEGALQQVGGQVVRERSQMAREALEDALRQEAEVALDYDGWRLLLGTLREVENETGAHLGRALDTELSGRLQGLSQGRYQGAALGADLETEGVRTEHGLQDLGRFSEGVKEQIATLLRVSVAEHLGTALVLDDHLAQTDPGRSEWFRKLLRESAEAIQVVVLTCRPDEYVGGAAGGLHVVDLAAAVQRQ